jgi:hypothetical protein
VSPLEQLAIGWVALARTLREARTWGFWAPVIAVFALQAVLVVLMVFAAHPLLSWGMAPLVRALSNDDALRYPELFRRLPGLVARADAWFLPVLGPLLAGWGTLVFADTFRGQRPQLSQALAQALSRAGTLIVASLPFHLVLLVVMLGESHLADGRISLVTRLFAPRIALGVRMFVQAVLLLVAPLVMLERRSLRETFTGLPGAARHAFLGALMIAAITSALPLPFDTWAGKSVPMVASSLPEKVAVVVLVSAFVQAASMVLSAGAAALLHRSVLAERDEWDG